MLKNLLGWILGKGIKLNFKIWLKPPNRRFPK